MEQPPDVVQLDAATQQLRSDFMQWQCRIRQIAMRKDNGRPSSGMRPPLTLHGGEHPITEIVTVLNRQAEFSQTMKMRHLARQSNDPAQRTAAALKFFSERYYQASKKFSDILTATFVPDSKLASRLRTDGQCTLTFEQISQIYELPCKVRLLPENDPLRDATFWHNLLFNSNLAADSEILGFEPDWVGCTAQGTS